MQFTRKKNKKEMIMGEMVSKKKIIIKEKRGLKSLKRLDWEKNDGK